MSGLLASVLVSFGVVFVAELGDKSQLMTLTFATRYRTLPVLAGVAIAVAVLQAISVGIGYGLGEALPTDWITVIAGVGFLIFAGWSLRSALTPESEPDPELATGGGTRTRTSTVSTVSTVGLAYFVAELGDKTMLATVTLATQYGWFGTWLGSTLAMITGGALAIVVGRQIGRRLPARAVGIGAAALFAIFGGWMLIDSLPSLAA